MKKVIYNISAIIMAIVVLCSTMSFTLDMHYCGTTLVDIALYKEAKSCGMEQVISDSPTCTVLTKKGCCTDKQFAYEGQDELRTSLDKTTFEQQVFVISFYYSYINLFEGFENTIIPSEEYPPPILIKDIQVLNQTFLI
ncbi:HYC_CC_PP family protein [Aquimarina longa]|uniref:HYC_CC_PP family protein n=1 Tax=Aquimarina longa TaxID=1080221 RepID=UPI0007858223|nr:hypothetical protein [Aquimarina longa]